MVKQAIHQVFVVFLLMLPAFFVSIGGYADELEDRYLIVSNIPTITETLKQEASKKHFIEIKLDFPKPSSASIRVEVSPESAVGLLEFFQFSPPEIQTQLDFNPFIPGVFPAKPPFELVQKESISRLPILFPIAVDALNKPSVCVSLKAGCMSPETPVSLSFISERNGQAMRLKDVRLNFVHGLGTPDFFKAVLEQLEHSSERIYTQPLIYDESDAEEPGCLLMFRADRAKMQVVDTYWEQDSYTGADYTPYEDRNGLESIYDVCEAFPEQSVIINGGHFFLCADEAKPKYARGRIIHQSKKVPSSTLRKTDDHNPKACDLKEYFVAQKGNTFGAPIIFGEGKVPLLPNSEIVIMENEDNKNDAYRPCDPSYKPITHLISDGELGDLKIFPDPDPRRDSPYTEALGALAGMETPHFVDKWSGALQSVIGYADIEYKGVPVRLLFVAVLDHNANQYYNFYKDIAGSGAVMRNHNGEPMLYDEKNCPEFGHPGDPIPNVFFLDAQLSVALAYSETDGKLEPKIAKERHQELRRDNPISNYLMFEIAK